MEKEPEGIYNLSVDGYHTYFISKCGILVHNIGCNKERQKNWVKL
ncbi:hypothetical protein [Clostridium sp. JS66]